MEEAARRRRGKNFVGSVDVSRSRLRLVGMSQSGEASGVTCGFTAAVKLTFPRGNLQLQGRRRGRPADGAHVNFQSKGEPHNEVPATQELDHLSLVADFPPRPTYVTAWTELCNTFSSREHDGNSVKCCIAEDHVGAIESVLKGPDIVDISVDDFDTFCGECLAF